MNSLTDKHSFFKLKNNSDIYLEQDGTPAQRYKSNKHLINELFSDGRWIQNPPNSPDYHIISDRKFIENN